MESANVLERKNGGAERTRRRRDEAEKQTGGSAASFFFYEGDSADDELAKLMPSLKRQFEAFDAFDEGTLNFMGAINVAKEESFRQNLDKENVASDRNSIRQEQSRRGSGRVTTSRPIDFNKLLQTIVPSPSSSLYKNITTVLKENVNRAGNQDQIVADFWSTEKKKKISAVARRKLTGIKTPAQTKSKAVEDRNVRHARSRRAKGNSRTLCKRTIKLDFRLDAAKISEWDQETLSEEELPPSTRAYSAAFMSTRRLTADAEEEVPPRNRACSGAVMSAGRPATDSPGSLPDMELSPDQSPGRVEHAQNPLQDPGSAEIGFPVPEINLQIQQCPLLSPTPPSNPVAAAMCLRHLEEGVRQRRLSFVGSPTPPSNPVAAAMCLRHLEGDVRQRRLSFVSSPWSESIHTGGGREMTVQAQKAKSVLVDDDDVSVNDWPAAKTRSELPKDETPVKEQLAPVKLTTPQGNQVDVGRPLQKSLDVIACPLSLIGDTIGIEEDGKPSPAKTASPEVSKSLQRSSLIWKKVEDVQARQPVLNTEQSAPGDVQLKASRDGATCILSREANALLTISASYSEDDEDLEVPDVRESKRVHHKNNGSCLGEQTEPNGLQHNQEESFGDFPLENVNEAQILPDELRATGDTKTEGQMHDEEPVHILTGLPSYPVGLERRVQQVQEVLKGGAVLGIFGMGGIGKTALAREVFNKISKEFEYTCFVDNVKGFSINELKKSILKDFHLGGIKLDGAQTQWSQMKGKKTLIVMDDTDSVDQLRVLPWEDFGHGSCLILTTRHNKVLKFFKPCKVYEVDFLTKEQARKLFCDHAFCLEHIPDYLKKHVDTVVEKCCGLPRTLEVTGRYLRNETSNAVWEETIDNLQNARCIDRGKIENDELWASLEDTAPRVDSHQNNPPTEEGVIWADEGSSIQAKPKTVKRKAKNAENRRPSLESSESKPPKTVKRKAKQEQDKRLSLEGCGSIWNNGQRKSRRKRIQPLEWWTGEKILYALIPGHSSCLSAIGVKKDGIVESYVPEEHSELVRFMAL